MLEARDEARVSADEQPCGSLGTRVECFT